MIKQNSPFENDTKKQKYMQSLNITRTVYKKNLNAMCLYSHFQNPSLKSDSQCCSNEKRI